MKILFIEDNPEFLRYVKNILEKAGHNVTEVDNADDAVSAIDTISSYDLVILDIMMMLGDIIEETEAKETGIAIYRRIREKDKKIKILILSARGKGDIWSFFEHDQNVSYHGKPIPSNYDNFLSVVEGK